MFRHSDFYTKEETDKNIKYYKDNKIHNSAVIQTTIIKKIYPLVSEEYVMLLGADCFLHLENMTILEYFKNKNISDDTAALCFIVTDFHKYSYKSNYNILESLNNKETTFLSKNCHFYTLAKKSLVIEPSADSHYYLLAENKKINFNGNSIDVTPSDNFYTVYPKILSFPFDIGNSCVLHSLQRDFQNSLIKGLYSWSNHGKDKNISEIVNQLITTKTPPGRWKIMDNNSKDNFFHNIDIKYRPSEITEKKYTFSEDTFEEIIINSGVSKERFDEWVLNFTDNSEN
jgi:hypothetical protein